MMNRLDGAAGDDRGLWRGPEGPRSNRHGRNLLGTRRSRGFTLIELIVVMAILGILAGIAIVQLRNAPVRAREAALREDLFAFRSCLDQYYAAKGHYPESLQTLVTEKFIRKVPLDPMTKSAETWQLTFEEPDSTDTATGTGAAAEEPPGIVDVHSGAKENGLDGTPYSTW